MEDKEKIIIDGVDVSQCEFYIYYSSDRYPHRCGIHKDMFGMPACCDVADCCKNCYFKQLQKEKFENLNNRQIVESAENLIYENSELYRNIKEKEQECERLKSYGATLLADKNAMEIGRDDYIQRCKRLEQECEELKEEQNEIKKFLGISHKPIMQRLEELHERSDKYKDRILELEQECEELKEENQELRNSLSSSLMFRFTSQDKEVARYLKALEEIEEYINSQGINNKWNMRIQRFRLGILDIISKAKGE